MVHQRWSQFVVFNLVLWIVDKRVKEDIAFVIHVIDIVEPGNGESEWATPTPLPQFIYGPMRKLRSIIPA